MSEILEQFQRQPVSRRPPSNALVALTFRGASEVRRSL